MTNRKIIVLAGPTAVGKTEVAIELAKRIDGEIVSCDAMQVYREVSIVTSRPTPAQLRRVPHYLIGDVSVKQNFDVARYNRLARKAIREIMLRGKIPIVVGGSGLYIQILIDGIFKVKAADLQLRESLFAEAERFGVEALHRRLAALDREAADKIHPNNVKRVVRALEVCLSAKEPMSQLQKKRSGLWGKHDIRLFVLNRPREELYQRTDARVEKMVRQGLIKEIKKLNALPLSMTAGAIIGVEEMRGYLKGDWDLPHALEVMRKNTRHLVKRQLTWFRRDLRFQWVEISQGETPNQTARRIINKINAI